MTPFPWEWILNSYWHKIRNFQSKHMVGKWQQPRDERVHVPAAESCKATLMQPADIMESFKKLKRNGIQERSLDSRYLVNIDSIYGVKSFLCSCFLLRALQWYENHTDPWHDPRKMHWRRYSGQSIQFDLWTLLTTFPSKVWQQNFRSH